jgi:hypothetical protein
VCSPTKQPGVKIPKKDEKNKDEHPSGTRDQGESYSCLMRARIDRQI